MIDTSHAENQVQFVESAQDLLDTPFQGIVNAMCWSRELAGDFSEIVDKIQLTENMAEVSEAELHALDLSEQGQLARANVLNDLKLLKAHGASPVLNVIKCYERDDVFPFISTDVYSFHVDRSPVPTDTFLCTYHGASSELVPNSQATQKVLIPEIRAKLRKLYDGPEQGFDAFLSEHFFDLHYQAKATARPMSLGLGNLWKLAVDHPESLVPPCLHRAPNENQGEKRLLLIC